jgi:hypothetical protein
MPSLSNHFVGQNDRRSKNGERRQADENHGDARKAKNVGDITIATISPYSLKEVIAAQDAERQAPGLPMTVLEKNYKIRLAHSRESLARASMLVQRMYLEKGYDISQIQRIPDRITLTASIDGEATGTLTSGIDSGSGLLADENYKQEIDQLRAEGRRIFEITKFAVDETRGSKRLLGALFNIGYIYGRRLQNQTDLVIEVTPRHAKFYRRMLGFAQIGPERLNSRVNTMGVLLRLTVDYVDQQIELWGGKTDQADGVKSLYPYFFSPEDQEGIAQRLLRGE